MNILFVHQNFPGQYKLLAQALGSTGKDQVVALTMADPVVIPGVKVVRHGAVRAETRPHPFLSDFDLQVQRGLSAAHACDVLKKDGFRPHLICAHPGWGEALFLKDIFPDAKIICLQEFFYRTSGSDVNFDPEFPIDDPMRLLQIRIRNANILLGLDLADCNVSPTEWQRSQFPNTYRQQIEVIHDGIATDSLCPNSSAWVELAGLRRRLHPGDEVVTFVNRNLEPYRGFHIFARAIPMIQKARPEAIIVCVGGDEVSYGSAPKGAKTWRESILPDLVGDIDASRVRFVGRLAYADYINLLQVSACHVYLTYPFVLSWSMLEAMSVGAVVVGSSTPPVLEVLQHGFNGYTVDFFSPEAVAERVVNVLSNSSLQSSIRETARRTIIDRFDFARVCFPKHLELFRSALVG